MEEAVRPDVAEELGKKNGWHGTNGACKSQGCSSWSLRTFVESHCAITVISWSMWKERGTKKEFKAPKQTELGEIQLSKGALKSFNDFLVQVNLSVPVKRLLCFPIG